MNPSNTLIDVQVFFLATGINNNEYKIGSDKHGKKYVTDNQGRILTEIEELKLVFNNNTPENRMLAHATYYEHEKKIQNELDKYKITPHFSGNKIVPDVGRHKDNFPPLKASVLAANNTFLNKIQHKIQEGFYFSDDDMALVNLAGDKSLILISGDLVEISDSDITPLPNYKELKEQFEQWEKAQNSNQASTSRMDSRTAYSVSRDAEPSQSKVRAIDKTPAREWLFQKASPVTEFSSDSISVASTSSKSDLPVATVYKNYFSTDSSTFEQMREQLNVFCGKILEKDAQTLISEFYPEYILSYSEQFLLKHSGALKAGIKVMMSIQSMKDQLLGLIEKVNDSNERSTKAEFLKLYLDHQSAFESAIHSNKEYENKNASEPVSSTELMIPGSVNLRKAIGVLREHANKSYQRATGLNQKYNDPDFAFDFDQIRYEAMGDYNKPSGARALKDMALKNLEVFVKSKKIINAENGNLSVPGVVAHFPEKQKQFEVYARNLLQHYHKIDEYRNSPIDPANASEAENIMNIAETVLQTIQLVKNCESQFCLEGPKTRESQPKIIPRTKKLTLN